MGALGEAFDWPVPVTMMLSLAAGITVSISGNKLLFKNADGIEIGSKTLSDDDLKIVEQTIEGENYSNLTEVVSAKEAEVYLHFLESGSTEGMTESELKAVQKIEELIKSNKIDYDGILKIRNETVKSDVEVVRKTTEDSVEDVGKSGKYSETEIRNIIYNLKGDGFKNNPLRQAYENEVAGLKAYGGELLTSGMSEEQVARTLNQARRDLGIKYKNATPQPLRDYIYEVNMRRYGDKLGQHTII